MKRYFLINNLIEEEKIKEILIGIHEINEYDNEQEQNKVNYKRNPIKLVVETFGGECYSGMSLVNSILTSETPIYTYSYGKTMSMGVPIFASGHKRFAHKNTTFMIHEMSGYVDSSLKTVEHKLEEWKRLENSINEVIYKNSKITKEMTDSYSNAKRDWFLSGKEAFDLGLVNELL